MKRWRFKTKKEFEKEFGSSWRRSIRWNYQGQMDYLCGTLLEENLAQELLKDGVSSIDGWIVSFGNITPCSLWKLGFKKKSETTKKH
jgi:hypothetical protein